VRGSIKYQVHQVFAEIIKFGQSKHEAKAEARKTGSKTWHDIGKNIEIYSYAKADQYRDIAKNLMSYAKQEFHIKDIEKLNSDHIKAFLESKIADGVKYSTFQKYAAALEKLEVALNRYAESHNTGKQYSFDISSVRQEAQQVLERTQVTRAYSDPKSLISNIQNFDFRIIAEAQLQGGFRISELNYMSFKNFLSDNQFQVISGKGGKNRIVPLSKEVYNALKSLVENRADTDGKYKFDMQEYRKSLKDAAKLSNQDLRYSTKDTPQILSQAGI
jgi:site-specific recombinase XerD